MHQSKAKGWGVEGGGEGGVVKKGSEVYAGGQARSIVVKVADGSVGTHGELHCAWHTDRMAWGN
jgi:hypothetical protein